MRRAMARAAVGDDDYGEDPAVNELQRLAAGTLGTESALFVPTATMANLIAVMCHCQRRGAQLFLGQDSHLHQYEHGGAAQVAGVHTQALPDLPNGTFDLDQLELTIREAHDSRYHPRPELICLENTHSSAGGRALPLTYLRQVRGLADRYGLRVHMDGARLMNAAVAQGVQPAQIAQHCDSVSLCFSKGLGAPAGAVLAGCREFVTEAWRVRKLLGGGMRQAGVLAAAARLGLQRAEATLGRDHTNARRFAEGIHVLDSPLLSINLAAVETNIVMHGLRALSGTATSRTVTPSSQGESWNLWPGSARRNWPWDCIRCLQALGEPEHSASPTAAAVGQLKARTGTSPFVLQMCSQPSHQPSQAA
ncbi:PREDICTED: probable low-specificity L-threonine aldolase 2 isoform X1 [Pseudopodoces humilis]|uniref:probable low-specificity L-threonine aldolase 2 isoform X1 n=1 Tax=Pseudopodoces humilis TaxID=181119 RepID=UPI0006B8616D|nr:PREDICTED: probable low-specificity L-threonine aldolase 2 isoform X1 [Pseudopodoces humilis]